MATTLRLTERELAAVVKSAFLRGRKSERARFDALLAAHLRAKQLGELNGTTELFKGQWDESKHKRGQPGNAGEFASTGGTPAESPNSGNDSPPPDNTEAMDPAAPKPVGWRSATHGLTREGHAAANNLRYRLSKVTDSASATAIAHEAFAKSPEVAQAVARFLGAHPTPESLAASASAELARKVGRKVAQATRQYLDRQFGEMTDSLARPHRPYHVKVTMTHRGYAGEQESSGGAFTTREEAERQLALFTHGPTGEFGGTVTGSRIDEESPTPAGPARPGDPEVPEELRPHLRATDLYTARRYLAAVAQRAPGILEAERKRVGEHLESLLQQRAGVRKHQWQEDEHARDHGKFASKPGGGEIVANGGKTEPTTGKEDAPSGATNSPPLSHQSATITAIPDDHLLEGLHSEVPAGLWESVVGRVRAAAQAVHGRLVLATPALLKLQHLLTTIFDHPDDLKRIGYQPSTSGVAGHETPDALREHLGVGGTLGARLVGHVLARVLYWMRRGMTAERAVGKAVDAADDPYPAVAAALHDALTVLAGEFGGTVADAGAVEAGLRALAERAGGVEPAAAPVPTVDTPLGKGFDPGEARDESGKWTSSGGGGGKGDAPAPSRDARRASATRARESHFKDSPHPDDGPGALAEHHKAVREHLVAAGATPKELAEYDRRVGKAGTRVGTAQAKLGMARAKAEQVRKLAADHDAKREELEAKEPPEPDYEPLPEEPEEPDYPTGASGLALTDDPERGDYPDGDEGERVFAADVGAWRAHAAEHAAWEKAHADWEAESEAVRARNEEAEAEYEKARDGWIDALDRHDDRAGKLEDAARYADDRHADSESDYADAHSEALDHVHDHVSEVEDAVHAREDAAEEADDEEEDEDEDEDDDPPAALGKAWKSDEHPRSDDGRFVDAHDLHDARTDPAKAKELRAKVTKPEERKKLDEAIGAEKEAARPAETSPAPDSGAKSGSELRSAIASELQAIQSGKDDPRGYESGPPAGLDMPKFTADLAGVVSANAAKYGGVGMHVADAYAAMKGKYPELSLDDFQRAAYQLFDDRSVVEPGGDPYGIDAHQQTDERLRALIPYGSKLIGYLKPGPDLAAHAARQTASQPAPKPSAPAPVTGPHIDASEAALNAELEADKKLAAPHAERTAHVDALLAAVAARHTPEELRELSRRVTGKGGGSRGQAIQNLRNELTAVTRLAEGQKV